MPSLLAAPRENLQRSGQPSSEWLFNTKRPFSQNWQPYPCSGLGLSLSGTQKHDRTSFFPIPDFPLSLTTQGWSAVHQETTSIFARPLPPPPQPFIYLFGSFVF
ncbi:hypothetical protein ACRRTK_012996 [Alexandromys fortis]